MITIKFLKVVYIEVSRHSLISLHVTDKSFHS